MISTTSIIQIAKEKTVQFPGQLPLHLLFLTK